MKREDLKVGDKVIYTEGIDTQWFIDGSELYCVKLNGSDNAVFIGPAVKDGVGGFNCKRGDNIQAYARFSCINPAPKPPKLVSFEEQAVTQYKTTITVQRQLSRDEMDAILKIVGDK